MDKDKEMLIKAMIIYSDKYGASELSALLLAYANVFNKLHDEELKGERKT